MVGLRTGIRTDLGCSITRDGFAQLPICPGLLLAAILVTLGMLVMIAVYTGMLGGQSSSILGALVMTGFTYIEWVPFVLCVAIWLIVAGFIINERRN